MTPIICIVGASNSGKTTFIERLIPALRARGYRVGTVKHDVHGFEMDREGKDTWRHRKAGAQTIAILSPNLVASIRETDREMDLEEMAGRYFWTDDVLIAEGFKRSHLPKIEVFRSAVEPAPICGPGDNVIAFVSDDEPQGDLPVFGTSDAEGIAELIEERFLRNREKQGIVVHLDGRRLPMKEFVRDFVIGGIQGMLSSLRGWKTPRKIDIQIRTGHD